VLRPIQGLYQAADYPDLLVGLEGPDDAAVWRLDDQHALVITTDFFTPVVDDAYDYGAIAAANSISDIYAMGGKPFLALNIAAFPPDQPAELLSEILSGGAEKAREAGVIIAGGHTVQDKEPKYGLVVLGIADLPHLITKGGAQIGDRLLLSKPLGFGVITTALKQQLVDPDDILETINWMKRLNKSASELAVAAGVHGGTDITGYSLLGHAWEMAQASGVGLRFKFDRIPFTQNVFRYAQEWVFPGGAADNRHFFSSHIQFDPAIDEMRQHLLFDPQTSGGLLLAVPADKAGEMLKNAKAIDQPMWEVGDVIDGHTIQVE
jgi:selenide,water dikinase